MGDDALIPLRMFRVRAFALGSAQSVSPGVRMYVLVKLIRSRHGRITCDSQGIVNGNVVFEAQITGTRV